MNIFSVRGKRQVMTRHATHDFYMKKQDEKRQYKEEDMSRSKTRHKANKEDKTDKTRHRRRQHNATQS